MYNSIIFPKLIENKTKLIVNNNLETCNIYKKNIYNIIYNLLLLLFFIILFFIIIYCKKKKKL